ncbi:MAG TPA: hypothetical protein VJA94_18725 [Candidatus Angelobacter sp.]
MKAAALSLLLCIALLASTNAWARDTVLPAGTLVTCTLDEPNFSSATASIGDPVLCHPHGLQVFGQTVFPRGTYIVGHLADDKDPGHFWGKGYLKIEFDRIGLPSADVPLAAKMIAVSGGYKVDKEGKIKGKGHAKRDIVEWMLPPLWPWKLLMLPARGPRPTLKGETRVTLRLMEDVLVPESGQYQRFGRVDSGETYGRPALYMRPRRIPTPSGITTPPLYRSVSWQPQSADRADSRTTAAADDHAGWHSFRKASGTPAPSPSVNPAPAIGNADDGADAAAMPKKSTANASSETSAKPATPSEKPASAEPAPSVTTPAPASATSTSNAEMIDKASLIKTLETETAPPASPGTPAQKAKLTLLAVKAGNVYAATDYWRDEDQLFYVLPNGKEGQIEMSELDWKTTTQLNTDRNVKVTLRDGK